LALLNGRTRLKTDLSFFSPHDRESVVWTSSYVHTHTHTYIYMENRTGSLMELKSGSHSSLYHFIGSSYFFFCCCFFSHMVLLFWCEVIWLLNQ
jgi:hypothetical protein